MEKVKVKGSDESEKPMNVLIEQGQQNVLSGAFGRGRRIVMMMMVCGAAFVM
jgi:hypothetical protein